jgi:hypothetical protein
MKFRFILTALAMVAVLASAGCVSKKVAAAQARAAYLAGQRDAMAQIVQQSASGVAEPSPDLAAITNITFVGPVENPVVPWSNGLTLAKAIVAAVYHSAVDPTMIVIKRAHQEIQIEPSRLLNGGDFPLLPGDVIQFQLPPQ